MFDEENSSVVEQEEAAPASTDEEVSTEEGEGVAVEAEQQEPTNDQWKEFREQAEHKANAKYESRMQKYNDMVASRFGKYTNPVTGKPVQTIEDYFEALDAQKEAERKRTIETAASQLDQQQRVQLMAAIENNPKQQKLEAQLAELQAKLNEQEGNRLFNEQMNELRKIDPTITGLDSLRNDPEFEEFDRLVRETGSLVNAYKLAYFDKITQRNAAATKQAAINAVRSKGHLSPVGEGTTPEDDGLTDSEYESVWKPFGYTRKEAALRHRKNLKERK